MDLIETRDDQAVEEAEVELLGERMSISVGRPERADALREELAADVRRGLGAPRKWLPPRWFYDARGCELFEEITRLPEYYQTRTEAEILQANAARIADTVLPGSVLELGAGSCAKTRILLAAMVARGLRRFVPVDVSAAALGAAARGLTAEFEGLHVHCVVADFVDALRGAPRYGRELVLFLGGTVGNLLPHERVALYRAVCDRLDGDGAFLLGVDLVKSAQDLHAAYDDAAGVTAAFNRNLLGVLNRTLGADFDESAFSHEAPYLDKLDRIEMHLRSRREQWVDIPGAQMRVHFAEGETLLTEISAKFTPSRVDAELRAADLRCAEWYVDAARRFALVLARPG